MCIGEYLKRLFFDNFQKLIVRILFFFGLFLTGFIPQSFATDARINPSFDCHSEISPTQTVICNSKVDVGGSILGSNVKVNQHCNDENTEGNPLSTTIGTTDYTPGEADDKEKERKVSENIEKVFKFDEDKDKKIYEKRYIQIMLIILVIVFVSLLGLGVIVL